MLIPLNLDIEVPIDVSKRLLESQLLASMPGITSIISSGLADVPIILHNPDLDLLVPE